MKNAVLFTLISFITTICRSQSEVAINHLTSQKLSSEQLDVIYEKTKKFPAGTQLAFGFIDNDEVYFYGVRRVNDSLQVIANEKSIFEIGSISKVFTSTLLAGAAVEDRLQLDEVISLPLKDSIKITYKQLSNHTSGLPRLPANLFKMDAFRTDNPYKNYTSEALVNYLQNELKLDRSPGVASGYSNLGAGLLGYLLSKNGNTTYDNLLKESIFSKYGMKASSTILSEVEEQLVLGQDKDGAITSNWDLASLKGAGGILSSTYDLSKFVMAQFNTEDEMLALSRKRTFTINKNVGIGLGWHIINTKAGETWYFHNGGTGGYSSSLTMDVDNKKAVIILSNVSAFHTLNKNIDPLCFELMKSLKE